jgi:uncharacterized protein DUF1918
VEKVEVGDRVTVESERVGAPPREGEILEVLGSGDGIHYFVRWEDGHQSSFYPSAGSSTIIHRARKSGNRKGAKA